MRFFLEKVYLKMMMVLVVIMIVGHEERKQTVQGELKRGKDTNHPGGGGTPLYKVYRYVPPQRVWFLSRFGLKTGIDFDNYGLKSGRVFGAGNIYESLQTYFSSQYVTGTTN